MKLEKLAKRILLFLIFSLATSAVVFLISFVISSSTSAKTYDVMTILGLLIVAAGALSGIGGNPSGVGISGIGQLNSQYLSVLDLEATKMERESTNYFKSAANHTTLYFTSSKLNVILTGFFVIATSIFLSLLS